MIKLDIKPYCENCPYFESKTFFYGDTIIQCENQSICENIKNYLKAQFENEEDN